MELEKCEFHQDKITFLNHIIGKYKIKINPKKIKILFEFLKFINIKKLQLFFKIINFNKKFIKIFFETILYLIKLIWKNII